MTEVQAPGAVPLSAASVYSNSCSICGSPKFVGINSIYCEDCEDQLKKAEEFIARKGLCNVRNSSTMKPPSSTGSGVTAKKVSFKKFEPLSLTILVENPETSQKEAGTVPMETNDASGEAPADDSMGEAWANVQAGNHDGEDMEDEWAEEPRMGLSRTSSDAVWKLRRAQVLGASLGTPKAREGQTSKLKKAPSM